MDEHLTAAGASWDPGPEAGEWIGPLLDAFGATLGHAVPAGYEAYAVVPIPSHDDRPGRRDYPVLQALLDELAPGTSDQVVHVALWEGWGWLHDRGDDPRTADGMGVFVVPHDEVALREAQEAMARDRVAKPTAAPLELPHRSYHLWSGPLAAAVALRHAGDIPSLIWPEDRSWCIGAPIYTSEIAVGADESTVRRMLEATTFRELGVRRARRDEVLRGDD